jgi:hypothetical protein
VGALGDQKGTAYAITISWNTSSNSLSVDFPSFCPIGRLQRAFTMRLSERRKLSPSPRHNPLFLLVGRLATDFRSTSLVSQVLNFSGLADAPTAAPPNVGCYRTLLDNCRFCPHKNTSEIGIYNAAGICRLHLVITGPHIHIHLVHYQLYGIIPYRLSVGAFQ